MGHRVDVKSYAAIPAILALAGAAFVLKPEDMRRDLLLETQGMIGIAAKYEVMYARCTDGMNTSILAQGDGAERISGSYSHQFPARNDDDAIRFALQARPQCETASLYRLERRREGAAKGSLPARTRIRV